MKHKYEGKAAHPSGTHSDVHGVPHKKIDGRHDHMRYGHHEMGEYKEGEHHHDHHRGKKD